MNTSMIAHQTQRYNDTGRRFVAKSEFEQGKHAYRMGKPLSACASDEMADGWLSCEQHERHGWLRCDDARGEQIYYRHMQQQAA